MANRAKLISGFALAKAVRHASVFGQQFAQALADAEIPTGFAHSVAFGVWNQTEMGHHDP
jgi:hypothetical protein